MADRARPGEVDTAHRLKSVLPQRKQIAVRTGCPKELLEVCKKRRRAAALQKDEVPKWNGQGTP